MGHGHWLATATAHRHCPMGYGLCMGHGLTTYYTDGPASNQPNGQNHTRSSSVVAAVLISKGRAQGPRGLGLVALEGVGVPRRVVTAQVGQRLRDFEVQPVSICLEPMLRHDQPHLLF